MSLRQSKYSKHFRRCDALARTMPSIESADGFRIGMRDVGVVFIAFALMLFTSPMAGATRYGEPENNAAREFGPRGINQYC